MAKEIPLTKGKVAIVDDEDYEELTKYNWYYTRSGYAARDARNTDRTKGSCLYMHKIIVPSEYQTDHINRDSLDNRKENLRPATSSYNTVNRGIPSHNKSGYKGVCWHKSAGKWSAEVKLHGVKYYLGLFDDKKEAADMYDFWAFDIHGNYASVNDKNGARRVLVSRG